MENTKKTGRTVVELLVGWLVILGSYLLIRMIFLMFGLLYSTWLGACLAIIPYGFGALYFWKIHSKHSGGFYALGILFPAAIEKIALYLLGAALYGISPVRFANVLSAISAQMTLAKLFPNPAMVNALDLSFLGWSYVLCSLAVAALFAVLLTICNRPANRKLSIQGIA